LRILATCNWLNGGGDKVARTSFPEIHNIRMLFGVERCAEGCFCEGLGAAKLENALPYTVWVAGRGGGVADTGERSEVVSEWGKRDQKLALGYGSDLDHDENVWERQGGSVLHSFQR
jgi:hypothetical protein